ncbi:MAG: prepilin-type N-terminal cleavage/methylation domain-containing protein [bacterium]|nr:prepilin-type N-terminal cleavage/methylation domain-containing protein [bacterium]
MKGFTLIETMIAITILTFAMAGPMFTAGRSIVAAQTARDQLTATYLAQEGIEYVRMMRDNEYLTAYHAGGADISSTAWSNYLTGLDVTSITRCIAPNTCTLDTAGNGGLEPCPGNSCAPLYLMGCVNGPDGLSCTPPNRYIQHELPGSVRSPFTRTIQAIGVSSSEEKIISTVSWSFHGTPYFVTVSDHLTPWQ